MEIINHDFNLKEATETFKKENIIKVLKILEKEHCLSLPEIRTIFRNNHIIIVNGVANELIELEVLEKIDLYLYRITIPKNKKKYEEVINTLLELDRSTGEAIPAFRVFKYTEILKIIASQESPIYWGQINALCKDFKCRRFSAKSLIKLGFIENTEKKKGYKVLLKKPTYVHGRQLLNLVKEEYLTRYSKKANKNKETKKVSEINSKKEKVSFFRRMFNFIKQ